MPAKYRVRLLYVERVTLNAVANSYDKIVFSLDNPYDPYTSVGGHQPRGYDQLGALYKKVAVINCSWRLRYSYGSTDTGILMTTRLCDTLDESIDFKDLMEEPRNRTKVLGASENSKSMRTVRGKVNLSRWTKTKWTDPERHASSTGAVTGQCRRAYLEIFQHALNAVTNPGNTDMIVELWYDLLFFDRADVAAS